MSIDFDRLLKGWYEAERLPQDFSPERSVPDFAFNVLNPLGYLYRPVIDESRLGNGGSRPLWPGGKTFAACITHDVDAVSSRSLRYSLRYRGIRVSKLTRLCKVPVQREDPLHCYERWLETEEAAGIHSTFFFWPGLSAVTRRHASDCLYELSDPVVFDRQRCTVAEMIREIDRRGWEIGLHPSWYTFDNADELKRQKETMERVVGHHIASVRQHFLHYDIRCTPRVQHEAGFQYDSTLGFNDNIGFRFGTCAPWYLYDLEKEEDLSIMEIPLIIQERAMLVPEKGMRLDCGTAFGYIRQMANTVENVGGVLTLLWHPESIVKVEWWDLYCRAISLLHEKSVWFATVKDIGDWWKANRVAYSTHDRRSASPDG